MTTLTQVLKSGIGPKLVPFFKTVAIYFVILIPVEQPSLFGALLKALPVLSLVAFVLLHGMSLGDEYFYSRRILIGLLFSVVGDVLLVWDQFFLHGLASFFVTQIFYISAFGFKPLNLPVAGVIYAIMAAGLVVLVPHAEGPLKIGIVLYGIMLMTMVWRAVARVQLVSELCTWTKLCSCAGGILFAFSDVCIGFHHFYAPLPYSQVLIMTTYYAAQLGISLSVVDCKASYLDALKKASAAPVQTDAKDLGETDAIAEEKLKVDATVDEVLEKDATADEEVGTDATAEIVEKPDVTTEEKLNNDDITKELPKTVAAAEVLESDSSVDDATEQRQASGCTGNAALMLQRERLVQQLDDDDDSADEPVDVLSAAAKVFSLPLECLDGQSKGDGSEYLRASAKLLSCNMNIPAAMYKESRSPQSKPGSRGAPERDEPSELSHSQVRHRQK